MEITGERTVPGVEFENYWFRRHQVVYEWLLAYVSGARVLEAGAGEGYGAGLMSRLATSVVALDYDATAATHAAAAYPGVPVVRGNLVRLPFADASFDLVVSLQTVEHLWDQEAFVAECLRVLRPGGRFVLSTPNRRTFPPGNPFHERELDAAELRALLSGLGSLELRGVSHGPRLAAWERRHGDLVRAQLAVAPAGWDDDLRRLVASVSTTDFEVNALHDSCLDLVAVVTGPVEREQG
jgi:SAM-dependent methyltransferase